MLVSLFVNNISVEEILKKMYKKFHWAVDFFRVCLYRHKNVISIPLNSNVS